MLQHKKQAVLNESHACMQTKQTFYVMLIFFDKLSCGGFSINGDDFRACDFRQEMPPRLFYAKKKLVLLESLVKFRCANKYDGVPFNRITNWCAHRHTIVSYIYIKTYTGIQMKTLTIDCVVCTYILDGRQAFLCITKRRSLDRSKITKHLFSRRLK